MQKIITLCGILTMSITTSHANTWQPLATAPDRIDTNKEIALVFNKRLPALYNGLTPQERIFIYYMLRASLPGIRITADQLHRDALAIRELFEDIVLHKDTLLQADVPFDSEQFLVDATTYLIYLWTNHCNYFMRENANQKRTPARLNLATLTKDNLIAALTALDYQDAPEKVDALEASIFDQTIEPTVTVPDSIKESAVNFYAPEFTDEDFTQLDPEAQTQINAYFYIEKQDEKRIPRSVAYKIGGKYDQELSVSLYWLEKAYEHTKRYPDQFDEHVTESLLHLCDFIKTGDEALFKKHSIAWLKSNSRLDYCFGFIENYLDPKSYRGEFQAEVTIKSMDINALNALLPALEDRLPFPEKFKRENLDDISAIPNASINTKAFAFGTLGPNNITLAYCLPNYAEIRALHGSKQIIYHPEKVIGELINSERYQQLFYLADQDAWLKDHDPDGTLRRDILTLHVILHETLGHGSSRLDTHTFVEGEPLTIEGTTYAVGNIIPVTSSNIQQFLAGYDQTIEELRAEIIALYSSLSNYDELTASGLLGDWSEKIAKEKMLELFVLDMSYFGLYKLLSQQEDATEISGDHARANITIIQWLVDHDAIEIIKEHKTIDNNDHTVLGIRVIDLQNAIDAITELAQKVQTIKSTGNGLEAKALIETYGTPVAHPEYIRIMKNNLKAVVGDLKVSASLFPHLTPVVDESGTIIDINASWPKDVVEQYQWFGERMLSTQ